MRYFFHITLLTSPICASLCLCLSLTVGVCTRQRIEKGRSRFFLFHYYKVTSTRYSRVETDLPEPVRRTEERKKIKRIHTCTPGSVIIITYPHCTFVMCRTRQHVQLPCFAYIRVRIDTFALRTLIHTHVFVYLGSLLLRTIRSKIVR